MPTTNRLEKTIYANLCGDREEREKERDTDSIANVTKVMLVVGHELGGALDVTVVELVVEEPVDGHHHGLLHLIRHHHPHHRLHPPLLQNPNQNPIVSGAHTREKAKA